MPGASRPPPATRPAGGAVSASLGRRVLRLSDRARRPDRAAPAGRSAAGSPVALAQPDAVDADEALGVHGVVVALHVHRDQLLVVEAVRRVPTQNVHCRTVGRHGHGLGWRGRGERSATGG